MKNIIPCLWFDNQAEEVASFYTSIFPKSKIGNVTRYGQEGFEIHGRPSSSNSTVMTESAGLPWISKPSCP